VSTDDERATRRDERERETIAALAMIAPTPDMIRRVLTLPGGIDDEAAPAKYAVIEVVPDQELVTADR
jgi:hypothetical protein